MVAGRAAINPGHLRSRLGTGEVEFVKVSVCDEEGRGRLFFRSGECCKIHLTFLAKKDVAKGSIGILVQNQNASTVYGFNTASDIEQSFRWLAGKEYKISFQLRLNLTTGRYFISASCNELSDGQMVCLGSLDSFVELQVTDKQGVFGVSNLFASIQSNG